MHCKAQIHSAVALYTATCCLQLYPENAQNLFAFITNQMCASFKQTRNPRRLTLISCKVLSDTMVKTWQCMKCTRARSEKQHGLQTAHRLFSFLLQWEYTKTQGCGKAELGLACEPSELLPIKPIYTTVWCKRSSSTFNRAHGSIHRI